MLIRLARENPTCDYVYLVYYYEWGVFFLYEKNPITTDTISVDFLYVKIQTNGHVAF